MVEIDEKNLNAEKNFRKLAFIGSIIYLFNIFAGLIFFGLFIENAAFFAIFLITLLQLCIAIYLTIRIKKDDSIYAATFMLLMVSAEIITTFFIFGWQEKARLIFIFFVAVLIYPYAKLKLLEKI